MPSAYGEYIVRLVLLLMNNYMPLLRCYRLQNAGFNAQQLAIVAVSFLYILF